MAGSPIQKTEPEENKPEICAKIDLKGRIVPQVKLSNNQNKPNFRLSGLMILRSV